MVKYGSQNKITAIFFGFFTFSCILTFKRQLSAGNTNTPGTAGGPGGRDRTLALKSRKMAENNFFSHKKIGFTPKKYFFLHISSCYAKILGQKLFRTWEFPRSKKQKKRPKNHLFFLKK